MVVFRIDSVVGIPVFFIQVVFLYYLDQLASIVHVVADRRRTYDPVLVPPELQVKCSPNCWEQPISLRTIGVTYSANPDHPSLSISSQLPSLCHLSVRAANFSRLKLC